MSRRSAHLLIEDILERIGRIERSIAGYGQDDFRIDDKTIDAVIRNLTVIGEAANRLPDDFKESHSDVPWRRIVGLRHRIVHDCFDVDLDLVWSILENELPVLKTQLIEIRGRMDSAG